MKMIMKKILIILIICLTNVVSAQIETTFEKANALYNTEEYQEAIALYKSILNQEQESVGVYYNLGNAYYKLSNIGESIYYYEKALTLSPNDEDVKNNLVFAKNASIDQIDVLPEGVFSRTFKAIINAFSFDGWAWLSIFSIVLMVVLFVLYYRAVTTGQKRTFFTIMLGSLGIALLSVFFAFSQYDYVKNNQFAIVMSEAATIKSEPNLRSDAVFELHEGTKVKITETLNNWKKIKLADGKIGWIPSSDVKEL